MWVPSFKFNKLSLLCLGLVSLSPAFGVDQQGQSLFVGKERLTGKIREHNSALPPEVVICANCHGGAKGRKIEPSYLLEGRQRRGGPPSVYDQDKFCRLLRTGVDPAYIMIAREMPVYEIADAQCASLWRFLTADAKQ